MDPSFAKSLVDASNAYLKYAINDRASNVYFESFPYKENLYVFDLFRTLAGNLFAEVRVPFSNDRIDEFTQFSFHNYKLKDYSQRNQKSHDQLTAIGQYAKVISNRSASQSTNPENSKSFNFGGISDLFTSKSNNIDNLADAFAKLLSSNYNVSYRGIFSGALFLQVDDFSRTNGNREDVFRQGYINLITQFCGGQDFEESFVIIDLNRVAEDNDYLYTHSAFHSLAREFALVNIHTTQSYLVSIGEHRFNGQNLWRYGNRNNLSRATSEDLNTDSFCLNNELLRDLDDYRAAQYAETSDKQFDPAFSKSAVSHPFATRIGRGITAIHGIEFSTCISGASIVHSPFSGLISESADDDKDAIQYNLNYASLLGSKGVREYELLKAKEQKQYMIGVIADLLKSRQNLITEVFNFNLARAKFAADSDFNDSATWASEKAQILELADYYHYATWLALYAENEDFLTSGPIFDAKPARMKYVLTEFLVNRGFDQDTIRNPMVVKECFSNLIGRLMAVANELDFNHNGNIFISQSLRKYAYYDGDAEYIPDSFHAGDSTFTVYSALNMHVFFNFGDDVNLASDFNGLPIYTGTLPLTQTNPNTLPMLGDSYQYWDRPVSPIYCQRLAVEFVKNDYRHQGYYDGRTDNRERRSDDLLILDIDPLLFDLNTIVSLPTIVLSLMRENDSEYYKPGNPLFTHALSLYNHKRFGYATGLELISNNFQSEFHFDFDYSSVRDSRDTDILTYIANYFGVVNMAGATGQYLTAIKSIKFDTEGGKVLDKAPIYLRDLACAIHKDTGKIPCTSKMASVILEVNQKLLDIKFNYMSGLAGVNFTNEDKLDIIEKAKPFVGAAFRRSTALFLYEDYK